MFWVEELPLLCYYGVNRILVLGGIMSKVAKVVKVMLMVGIFSVVTLFIVDRYNLSVVIRQLTKENTMDNPDAYVEKLREALLNRDSNVILQFKGSSKEVDSFVGDAVEMAFAIDDPSTSSDFDYMKYSYTGTQIKIKGLLNAFTVEYSFEYNETLEQTKQVDEAIIQIFKQLEIDKKNDYEKIKAIHDYIIVNTSYDLSAQKNTAYHNLIDKSSVCQGYALLTYKMMVEAGIDCRIITGTGKGVNHAWNIVKLNGKWYNIDCTWDDPVSEDNKSYLEYRYFLKADKDFSNHVRDKKFTTEEFYKEYEMSETSYDISNKNE